MYFREYWGTWARPKFCRGGASPKKAAFPPPPPPHREISSRKKPKWWKRPPVWRKCRKKGTIGEKK